MKQPSPVIRLLFTRELESRLNLALAARLALTATAFALASCASIRPPSPEAFWSAQDTPGAALAITEVGRSGTGFEEIVTYALSTRGLAPGPGYQIGIRRADGGSAVPVTDAIIAEDGDVKSVHSTPERRIPIEIDAKKMAPGEPIEIRVAAPASPGSRASAEVIPRPVASPSDGPCHLSARFERRPELGYLISLSGYSPNEPIDVSITNSNGSTESATLPGPQRILVPVSRVLTEPATLTIIAASRSCRAEALADFMDVPR